tara:strand:- start:6 stop:1091 length:1086 start_codon:yes stop_codon:yes gene_type:complete
MKEKVAIIGTSYSVPQDDFGTFEERFSKFFINKLGKLYPNYEFHSFAVGATNWEYAQQMLYFLAKENYCKKVILELADFRYLAPVTHKLNNGIVNKSEIIEGKNWFNKHLDDENKGKNYIQRDNVFYHNIEYFDSPEKYACPSLRANYLTVTDEYLDNYDTETWYPEQCKNTLKEKYNDRSDEIYFEPVLNNCCIENYANYFHSQYYIEQFINFIWSLKHFWSKHFKLGIWLYDWVEPRWILPMWEKEELKKLLPKSTYELGKKQGNVLPKFRDLFNIDQDMYKEHPISYILLEENKFPFRIKSMLDYGEKNETAIWGRDDIWQNWMQKYNLPSCHPNEAGCDLIVEYLLQDEGIRNVLDN